MSRINISTIIIIVMSFIFLTIYSCEDSGSSSTITVPADFLPKQGDIEGWTKGSGTGDYLEASNQSSLYDIIDGGAEVYITHGFLEGVQQLYYGDILGAGQTLTLFITDQGDSTGAYNLFHDAFITPTSHSPLDYGDEGRLNEGLLFDYEIDFRLDEYYVRLTLNKEGMETEALQVLQLFASAVESNMEG
ncbi:MAG: hypothetical protein HQ591_08800 [candidate division Zixibacteria bacterium]|nr:hypothetical protein [Candidatus Tariuqbacter arcticus]